MPTRARPDFAARAVEYFRAQTWPEKELIIVDDADAPSFTGGLIGAQYHRLNQRLTIGAKRNVACSRAHGNILCHWDDDDYSAPGRIADQVQRLAASGAGITGYCAMVFHDEDGKRWKFTRQSDYALGTSLMYTRDFWKIQPFNPDLNEGEDNAMVHRAVGLVAVDAGEMMTATVHSMNTSPRLLSGKNWQQISAVSGGAGGYNKMQRATAMRSTSP